MRCKAAKLSFLAGVAFLAVSADARGVVIFQDDFEAAPEVTTSTLTTFAGPDADPVAEIGSWVIGEADERMVQVTNLPSGGTEAPPFRAPGPFQGTNYLREYRAFPSYNSLGVFANPTAAQTNPSDLIRLDFMAWTGDLASGRLSASFLGSGGISNYRAEATSGDNGHVFASTSGGSVDTGISYTPQTWQHWVLEYAVNASTFSVSVDGITASGFASFAPGDVTTALIYNGSPIEGVMYLDSVTMDASVPEPATCGMLVLFAGAVVVKRRSARTSRP